MRVVIFFLCLCFLLPGGSGLVFASTQQHGNSYSLLQDFQRDNSSNITGASQDCFQNKVTGTGTERQYLVGDNSEDEDANNVPAEKYRLLARSHSTHIYPEYPSILNYLCNCYKIIPSVCIPASDKYILQGTLRI